METPIIDPKTLTEEQKNDLRIIYESAIKDIESEPLVCEAIGYGRSTLLERIFGEELFEKGE